MKCCCTSIDDIWECNTACKDEGTLCLERLETWSSDGFAVYAIITLLQVWKHIGEWVWSELPTFRDGLCGSIWTSEITCSKYAVSGFRNAESSWSLAHREELKVLKWIWQGHNVELVTELRDVVSVNFWGVNNGLEPTVMTIIHVVMSIAPLYLSIAIIRISIVALQ